jgi:mannose-6-phosphate isomerase-like protein (cupin superfamily)
MRGDRGTQYRLVGRDDGAAAVDLHLNVLNADSGPGPYHVHDHVENVYVILEGTVSAVVDGQAVTLGPGDIAFIPPGVPHSAGSDGTGLARVLEIYAPAPEAADFRILPNAATDQPVPGESPTGRGSDGAST